MSSAVFFRRPPGLPDCPLENGASDYAVTADGGDFAVHIIIGVDPEERIYLLDLCRAKVKG
jgi:hypothetical protein